METSGLEWARCSTRLCIGDYLIRFCGTRSSPTAAICASLWATTADPFCCRITFSPLIPWFKFKATVGLFSNTIRMQSIQTVVTKSGVCVERYFQYYSNKCRLFMASFLACRRQTTCISLYIFIKRIDRYNVFRNFVSLTGCMRIYGAWNTIHKGGSLAKWWWSPYRTCSTF